MLNFDLYTELGVSRDATRAQIKTRYRIVAKTAHPDAGGNAETFQRLTLAYNVLHDPARRARYDKTGEFDDESPDNLRAGAYSVIEQHMAAIMNAHFAQPHAHMLDPRKFDVVMRIMANVRADIEKGSESIELGKRTIAMHEDMASRFSPTTGEAAFDPIVRNFKAQAERTRGEIKRIQEAIAVREKALEILVTYTYRIDGVSPVIRPYATEMRALS